MTPELAELVGYFMGDGSLHAKGIRLCVADTDLDVVERLRVLTKELFGLEPVVTARPGYQEVTLSSVRLARWWQAAGFAKELPTCRPHRQGLVAADAVGDPGDQRRRPSTRIPARSVRGRRYGPGRRAVACPRRSETFAAEVRTLLLALGLRHDHPARR